MFDFTVDADGNVSQSQRAPQVVLDNVRRLAADHFLGRAKLLSKNQRNHWINVARPSDRKAA